MKKLKLTLASFAFGILLTAAPITAFAACRSGWTETDWDTGVTWDCYYEGQDTEWCYYTCYAR